MTFRKLTLAALVTSATALGAHAGSGTETISENGHKLETNMAAESGNDTIMRENFYMENGHKIVSVTSVESGQDITANDGIDSGDREAIGTFSEQEVVLAAATDGAMVRTVDGDKIGVVVGTRDIGEAGHLVLVDIADEAKVPASQVFFTVDTLKAIETGDGIQYGATLEHLREHVRDALDG